MYIIYVRNLRNRIAARIMITCKRKCYLTYMFLDNNEQISFTWYNVVVYTTNVSKRNIRTISPN